LTSRQCAVEEGASAIGKAANHTSHVVTAGMVLTLLKLC
jgi:hypothetical protein